MSATTLTRPATTTAPAPSMGKHATRVDVRSLTRADVGSTIIVRDASNVEQALTIHGVQQFRALKGARLTLSDGQEHSLTWGRRVALVGKNNTAAQNHVRELTGDTAADVSLPRSARIDKAVQLPAANLADTDLRSAVEFSAGTAVTYGTLEHVGAPRFGMIPLTVSGQQFAVPAGHPIRILPIDPRTV